MTLEAKHEILGLWASWEERPAQPGNLDRLRFCGWLRRHRPALANYQFAGEAWERVLYWLEEADAVRSDPITH